MSTMDALPTVEELIDTAKMGPQGIAITDHAFKVSLTAITELVRTVLKPSLA